MPSDNPVDACGPESDNAFCVRTGSACGSVQDTDNCGQIRTASCGQCGTGWYCNAQAQCACSSESAAALCARKSKTCGAFSAADNCGRSRSVNCGTCGSGLSCNGQNQCECAPETNASFCARSGKACGAFSGTDNCGQPRTVADCGSCDDANACTNDVCSAGTCRHVDVRACAQECSPSHDCGLVDSDGDGLNDVWETNGYVDIDCNGQNDEGTDTPLPGADKNKPNVYVKWDYMEETQGSPNYAHSHLPAASAMTWAQTILANHNIVLTYYPTSDAIAEKSVVSASPPDALPACAGSDAVSFYTLKTAHFPARLAPAYHYAIFAHYNTCDSYENCMACPVNSQTVEVPSWMTYESSGIAVRPGKDFIVSLGFMVDFGSPPTDLYNTGAFLHQLGHNMGLRNGGGDDLDGKPNYISVMNANYEFGISRLFPWNPAYPWSLTSNNPAVGFTLDFSTFAADTLHEGSDSGEGVCVDDGSGGLDETLGVATPDSVPFFAIRLTGLDRGTYWGPAGGHPIDWNASLAPTDHHVFGDISGDGKCSDLPGFNDMELAASDPGVTKLAHLQPNAACATGTWTNGTSAQP